MDYGSLSTVVVLAIVALAVLVWLPRRTVDGMKRVVEHREDRHSPSLHLVSTRSGMRFSDGRTSDMRGESMRAMQTRDMRMTAERVARIRRLRRQAAGRRRVVVAVLFAAVLVVSLAAAIWRFSAAYALIPMVPLVTVLALGIRAAGQARQWERGLSAGHVVDSSLSKEGVGEEERSRIGVAHDSSGADAAPTDVLEQREIRRALRHSRADKTRIAERRQIGDARHDDDASSMREGALGRHGATDSRKPHEAVESCGGSGAEEAQGRPAMTGEHAAEGASEGAAIAVDATDELHQVRAAKGLDAFDMAVSSQDLISFSMGRPRDGVPPRIQEPESLEIKSTRQVAKAVAVEPEDVREGVAEGSSPDDGTPTFETQSARSLDGVSGASAFHEAESSADVDVPVATSDSLGAGLETVLARRSA